MSDYFDALMAYMTDKPVINTHSHHMDNSDDSGLDLDRLLKSSYVNWCGIPIGDTPQSRTDYLEKVKYNSYFVWLQKALQEIYHIAEPLTAENWDEYSFKINKAHLNSRYHIKLLEEVCCYRQIVLDTYWEPGSDNGYPNLFTPTFRINMFLFGYNREAADHNGNNPRIVYNEDPGDIDEYIEFMRRTILNKIKNGCVALKNALAYDRGLDFFECSREKAQKAYNQDNSTITPEDIINFQNYVFFELCKVAAEFGVPIQSHTGLGKLYKTNALSMREVIDKNPETKFVLFHGSYPWMEDITALVHSYGNVYPDLCWLPLISTSASMRIFDELIEVGNSDKICWGCDTWTSEESYGALLAARFAIAKVLTGKILDNYISFADAQKIVDNVLYNNPKKLYGRENMAFK
jgi:predicted TIM-barrel fold metal-dependent hydrolase